MNIFCSFSAIQENNGMPIARCSIHEEREIAERFKNNFGVLETKHNYLLWKSLLE